MASKPAKLPSVVQAGPPRSQPSVATRIFKNNRTADRAFPMVQQKYPKFMGRIY